MHNQATNSLQQLLQEMDKQSILYKPTTFWKEASKVIIDELKQKELKNFRSFDSSLSMFVPTFAFPYHLKNKNIFKEVKNTLAKATDDVKSKLKLNMLINGEMHAFADFRVLEAGNVNTSPYTDKISESSIGNPLEQFKFNNRMFSRSLLNYLLGITFLKKYVDTSSIKNVFEIGGGFGTLGEILLGDERNKCFYINADIPPVLHLSSYYLKSVFRSNSIGTFDELKNYSELNIQELSQKYKALNIPSWCVPKLTGSIDLFVNFISFQEMEPNVVQNYCMHIERLQPSFVLLRNMEEGKKKKDKDTLYGVENPILGKDYDIFLPNYELIAQDSTVFGFVTEDGFHSQLRLYQRKI